MNKKAVVIGYSSVLWLGLFWTTPWILFLIFVGISAYLVRDKKHAMLFAIIAIVGSCLDLLGTNIGAWTFTNAAFPVWLPLLYGISAITIKETWLIIKKY